jgi:trimeric autotransporter adhesin
MELDVTVESIDRRIMSRSKPASRPFTHLMMLALSTITLAACSSKDSSPATGSWPVGSTAYVPILRGTHPLALPNNDLGRLDPSTPLNHLSLVFALSPAKKAERDALLEEIQRPGSTSYHQWLTPDD